MIFKIFQIRQLLPDPHYIMASIVFLSFVLHATNYAIFSRYGYLPEGGGGSYLLPFVIYLKGRHIEMCIQISSVLKL